MGRDPSPADPITQAVDGLWHGQRRAALALDSDLGNALAVALAGLGRAHPARTPNDYRSAPPAKDPYSLLFFLIIFPKEKPRKQSATTILNKRARRAR
jgi:hypothetical protein